MRLPACSTSVAPIRAALGDEQLSFIGISYGTYLGSIYATLFPERVRALVLDAAFEAQLDGAFSDEPGGLAWLRDFLRQPK